MNERTWTARLPWLISCGVCAATLAFVGRRAFLPSIPSAAETPLTVAAPRTPPDGVLPPGALDPRDLHRPRGVRNPQAIEAEWPEAEKFLHDNAPHYYEAIKTLSPKLAEDQRLRLHGAIVSRYQTLRRVKEHFPELHEVRLEQLRLFDNLFDTRQRYALAAAGPGQDKLKAQIRDEVGALFDNAIKDRQTRVARLQEMLGKLNERVQKETESRDTTIEQHMRIVLDKGVDPSLLDGMYQNEPDAGGTGSVNPRRLPHIENHPTLRPTTRPTTAE